MGSMLTEKQFELQWKELVSTHTAARVYHTTYVYPHKELWCHVWIRRYTTFTQRCEDRSGRQSKISALSGTDSPATLLSDLCTPSPSAPSPST